jgi:hypothetical protein
MILVVTSREDATADFLCDRLRRESVSYCRFDTDDDLRQVHVEYDSRGPVLTIRGERLSAAEVNHVWYRRPKPVKPPVETSPPEAWQIAYEWSEAIEGFLAHIPLPCWINHPSCNVNASHKLEQLTRAKSIGLSIPETVVTQSPDTLASLWTRWKGAVIAKPLGCGYVERATPDQDTHIFTNQLTERDLERADSLGACPTLFQQLVDKTDDVRVVTVDQEVTAIAIRGLDQTGRQRVDIRRNNMSDVEYQRVDLPNAVARPLIELVQSYSLRFAAIDLAIDRNGNWVFFEVNPNGQWAWLDLAGASDIASSFVRSFDRKRCRG